MDEPRGDAGIHATAQAENHALTPDLLANRVHRRLNVIQHRPFAAAAANAVDEVADDLRAARRVDDFGMKLQPKEFQAPILERRVARILRDGYRFEPSRKLRELVAM